MRRQRSLAVKIAVAKLQEALVPPHPGPKKPERRGSRLACPATRLIALALILGVGNVTAHAAHA
jgi:hypothetical protein